MKPMPKPGWELTTKRGEYAQAYDYYGEKLTEGVKEVAWTGGNLPDEWYDEFVLRVRLPDAAPGTVVRFPVVQNASKVCTAGSRFQPTARTWTRWTSAPFARSPRRPSRNSSGCRPRRRPLVAMRRP